MNISLLIDKNYSSCSILEDMEELFEWLKESNYLVVVNEELKVAGIVNQNDLIAHPTGRIIDFDFSKPTVSPDSSVIDAFNLMVLFSTNCLPVFNKVEFLGVVFINDLTRHLIKEIERYKMVFQEVTHDIRCPIANIISLNGMLEENLEKPENIELLEMSKQASSHALDILSELLLIERSENEQNAVELTDLNDFFRECLDNLKGILSTKKIELICELPNEKFPYLINKVQLKRTVHNITSNAIKFSYPGSKIHVSSIISGKQFTLTIRDRGIGIPLIEQPCIFDQFTHSSRPGTSGEQSTGLGLYFAKSCIERLRGKIWFESTEGQGTTFFVEFKT